MGLDWNGGQLLERVAEAARSAVDDVLEDADRAASVSHVWVNRTGQLEEEIVSEAAIVEGHTVHGRFGTTERRGFYGWFHEIGTVNEIARPFLRPAADATFPTLAGKIARRLR